MVFGGFSEMLNHSEYMFRTVTVDFLTHAKTPNVKAKIYEADKSVNGQQRTFQNASFTGRPQGRSTKWSLTFYDFTTDQLSVSPALKGLTPEYDSGTRQACLSRQICFGGGVMP
jgi:hypothetical protein